MLDQNGSSPPVLQIHHLGKAFGDVVAVTDLSFSVCQGEVFGFLGPNGAGKSTTINMISGLLQPDQGAISLYGKTLEPGSKLARGRLGVCPQELVVWPKLTCFEQLVFMGQMYELPIKQLRHRADQLLGDLGLSEKRNKLAGTLSGGMQRRLNLLLALVHDPEVVILDEPEAGLDPQSRVLVREYIRAMARQKTILFTTHNMDEAERICDRVAIIDHGNLLQLDTPAALKGRFSGAAVLEVFCDGSLATTSILAKLKELAEEVVVVPQGLMMRGGQVIAQMVRIIEILKSAGIEIAEIKVRENSLEDVFIALTGRRLRE
jgi:ABC-2 type transport system ATP-binding protein